MIKEDEPLTVEIVYKFNIGVGNLEVHDTFELIQKFKNIRNEVNFINPNQTIKKFAKNNKALSLFEIRGLHNLLKNINGNKKPTIADFIKWFDKSQISTINELKHLDSINGSTFSDLVKISSFTKEERKNQYTGRKIFTYIHSSYSVSGIKNYKPWVDQQELLQTFDNIEKHYSENDKSRSPLNLDDYYAEKLAHIICKKHLLLSHPTEGFRIGTIIPAYPNRTTNTAQFYILTDFYNSSTGIVEVVLTPATEDSDLPIIYLMRSTASSPYAYDGEQSVKPDLNPFDSPGYLGSKVLASYDSKKLKNSTIPIWSAYRLEAEHKMIEQREDKGNLTLCKEIIEDLSMANATLLKERLESVQNENFQQILSNEMHLLFDLVRKLPFKEKLKFPLTESINKYSNLKNNAQLNLKTQRKDAISFYKKLKKIIDKYPDCAHLCHTILPKLEKFIDKAPNNALLSQEFENESASLNELKNISLKLANNFQENRDQLINTLNEWNSLLKIIEINAGEDLSTKTKKDIIFVGHSLGGAIAQRYFIENSLIAGRVPVPGHVFSLKTFDSPGINMTDYREFVRLGIEHAQLLSQLGRPFKVDQKFEVGDPIPGGGGIHVGSLKNVEEQKASRKWIDISIRLNKTLETVNSKEIGLSETVHATQFEGGQRKSVYSEQDGIGADYESLWLEPTALYNYDVAERAIFSHKGIESFNSGLITPSVLSKIGYIGGLMTLGTGMYDFETNTEKKQNPLSYGNWQKYCDENGAFAMTLRNGIESSKSHKN